MQAFFSTIDQMLFLFLCMLIGFVLNKAKILPENADSVLSKLENAVLMPALVINSFRTNCTLENLTSNSALLLYSLALLGISAAVAMLFARFFTKNPEEVGLYKYSLCIANFGFMGNALVQGLLGDDVLFLYLIFTLPMSLFVYTVGVVWLTAGAKKFTPKALLSPMIFSVLIGLLLGAAQLPLPSFVTKTLSGCSACFSPIAMILTGFVIAKFDILSLIKKWNIYALSVVRMVAMPLAIFGLCLLLKVPKDILVLIMFTASMPLGLNTIVFPAAYGKDETPGAAMAVISNVIGIITVPLILSLVL